MKSRPLTQNEEAVLTFVRERLQHDYGDDIDWSEAHIGPAVHGRGGTWVHVCVDVFVPDIEEDAWVHVCVDVFVPDR